MQLGRPESVTPKCVPFHARLYFRGVRVHLDLIADAASLGEGVRLLQQRRHVLLVPPLPRLVREVGRSLRVDGVAFV